MKFYRVVLSIMLFGLVTTTNADPFYKEKEVLEATNLKTSILKTDNTVKKAKKFLGKKRTSTNNVKLSMKENMVTKILPLKFNNAQDLVKVLKELYDARISLDKHNNTIIINATKKEVNAITHLVNNLDTNIKQVVIKAKIVTINTEDLEEMGIKWKAFLGGGSSASDEKGKGSSPSFLGFDFGGAISNALFSFSHLSQKILDLELSALESENSVDIIATPTLMTVNNEEASIKQGTELAYPKVDNKGVVKSVEFRDAVLELRVKPYFINQDTMLLDLLVTQNSPSLKNSKYNWVSIDKQEVKTNILTKNGQTVVLGGIFQNSRINGRSGIPILGNIPFLKYLFSHKSKQIKKRQLVIFISSYVI